MEKPTYTAIDYNSKENKVIEERIRNYYLPVKNTFEAVLYGRLNIPDSPRGLCADLIDVSRTISREFALVEEVFLWRHVIKPWFTPQRFPISKEHNDNRIKILECALEDLERIKREGEPKLPPLTFEEPKIYP